jgi:hypothetical protein
MTNRPQSDHLGRHFHIFPMKSTALLAFSSSLQSMTHGNWVAQTDLYPAGKGTVASLVSKGWIEQGVDPKGARQFRITPSGRCPPEYVEADRHGSRAAFARGGN